jgi:hypothetical protein
MGVDAATSKVDYSQCRGVLTDVEAAVEKLSDRVVASLSSQAVGNLFELVPRTLV